MVCAWVQRVMWGYIKRKMRSIGEGRKNSGIGGASVKYIDEIIGGGSKDD